jgi:fatty acid synthase
MTNKFVSTTALQIALIEVLLKLDIIPDGIIGHSFSEIACAYADQCLSTEEAILTSYWRGVVTENDNQIPKGLMAEVGLSWEETKILCPKGVYVVCNNSKELECPKIEVLSARARYRAPNARVLLIIVYQFTHQMGSQGVI